MQPLTIFQLNLLRVLVIIMMILTGSFGLYLIIGSIILAMNFTEGTGEGSQAFFMSVSGLTLLVFSTGFGMMTKELTTTIKART